MIPTPITSDWLFSGAVGQKFTAHLNFGTSSALSYDLVDRETGESIGMLMSSNSYKRTHKDKSLAGKCIRTWHVGSFQSDDVEEALDVLNAKRAGVTAEEPAPAGK
jgi:hypothetical protein